MLQCEPESSFHITFEFFISVCAFQLTILKMPPIRRSNLGRRTRHAVKLRNIRISQRNVQNEIQRNQRHQAQQPRNVFNPHRAAFNPPPGTQFC